jgi:hypothetical protein
MSQLGSADSKTARAVRTPKVFKDRLKEKGNRKIWPEMKKAVVLLSHQVFMYNSKQVRTAPNLRTTCRLGSNTFSIHSSHSSRLAVVVFVPVTNC